MPIDPSENPALETAFQRLDAEAFAHLLREHPGTLLLDARDANAYAHGHLDGAIRLDGCNHEQMLIAQSRERRVAVYCYHGKSSQFYAQMFIDFGFRHVCDLVGGHEAWSEFLRIKEAAS